MRHMAGRQKVILGRGISPGLVLHEQKGADWPCIPRISPWGTCTRCPRSQDPPWLKWKCTGGSLFFCTSQARLLQLRHNLDKHMWLCFLLQLKLEMDQCLPGQWSSLPLKLQWILRYLRQERGAQAESSGQLSQPGRGQLSQKKRFVHLA